MIPQNKMPNTSYAVSPEMMKVREVQVDLLSYFLRYCETHNLRCWVEGGTLLGAVRHKGFIPWDDDIDVAMLREDYDRMCHIGNEGIAEPYFLQTAFSDKDYHRGHAQFRRSDTAAIRPSDAFEAFNQGIFIDIFPLDAVPDDREKVHQNRKASIKILRMLRSKNCNLIASGRISLLFRKMKVNWRVKRHGWLYYYNQAEEYMRELGRMPHTKVAELTSLGEDIVWDKSIFDETIYLPFEHIEVPCPKEYDAFLRATYGPNYMTPIQAPSMHGTLIFDTERSYKELLPQVQKAYKRSMFKRLKNKLFKK